MLMRGDTGGVFSPPVHENPFRSPFKRVVRSSNTLSPLPLTLAGKAAISCISTSNFIFKQEVYVISVDLRPRRRIPCMIRFKITMVVLLENPRKSSGTR